MTVPFGFATSGCRELFLDQKIPQSKALRKIMNCPYLMKDQNSSQIRMIQNSRLEFQVKRFLRDQFTETVRRSHSRQKPKV